MNMDVIKTNFMLWFVKRLPRRLVYWCGVVMFAHGTTGMYGDTVAGELTLFEALERWNGRGNNGNDVMPDLPCVADNRLTHCGFNDGMSDSHKGLTAAVN